MKKEVRHYLSIGFLVLAVLILVYLFNLGMTGFAVLPEEYENQTVCEAASVEYVWYDEACYDEQPVCDTGFLELCLDETNCTTVGSGHWYDANEDGNSTCNAEEEPSCTNNLILCLDETNCTTVGSGHWYDANEDGNSTCNAEEEPSCSNDLTLCDETNCVSVGGGYWYNEECNLDECAGDSDCDSGYECSTGGSCEVIVEEEGEEETVSESEPEPTTTIAKASLSASEISALLLNPGSSQETTVIVKNTGTKSLTSCKIKPVGEFDSWISVSEGTANINLGKQHEFSFNVLVPEETEEGSYSLRVSIKCSEIFSARAFTVNVEKKKLEFEVISADRTRSNRVRIIYSLEELAGEDQDVAFIFSLVDVSNVEVGKIEVNQSIDANSIDEFKTNIEINESLLPINETTNETLESELTLNVNFNSEIYSSSVRETITLGAPIGGFAIFEGVGAGEAVIFVVVLFVLVFIFVFARRMRRRGKTLKDLINKR